MQRDAVENVPTGIRKRETGRGDGNGERIGLRESRLERRLLFGSKRKNDANESGQIMRGWGTASYEDIPESQHVFWAGISGQGAHVERDSFDAV